MNRILNAILAAVLLVGLAAAPVQAQTSAKQKVVVHLIHHTDNLHSVKTAVHLGGMMQIMGAEVTLLPDLDGVRLADTRQPGDLIWGKGDPISKELAAFVKAAGRILLCPDCARHAGITFATLRPGARIGAMGELPKVILAADKILDY
ncbi:MAG: DsrE family protein [Bryobacteraceae bacterium]